MSEDAVKNALAWQEKRDRDALRDQMAMAALTGMVVAIPLLARNAEESIVATPASIAHDCYLYADAMMKAREGKS